jgi:CTP synthase (UTP-ammonia lyase)
VITALACSLQGREIAVDLTPGSLLSRLHGGEPSVRERTTCDYGLAPALQHLAGRHGMRVAGVDDTGEVRAIERDDHPFFVGTLYQPQLRSRHDDPHPVLRGFLRAAAGLPPADWTRP